MTLLQILELLAVLTVPAGVFGAGVWFGRRRRAVPVPVVITPPPSTETPSPRYELVNGDDGSSLDPPVFLDEVHDPVGAHHAQEERGRIDGRTYGVVFHPALAP